MLAVVVAAGAECAAGGLRSLVAAGGLSVCFEGAKRQRPPPGFDGGNLSGPVAAAVVVGLSGSRRSQLANGASVGCDVVDVDAVAADPGTNSPLSDGGDGAAPSWQPLSVAPQHFSPLWWLSQRVVAVGGGGGADGDRDGGDLG